MIRKAEREEDYYASIAPGYEELHREEQERKIRLVMDHFPIDTHESLLDVGCGTGFSLDMWPTTNVLGAEPSAGMIRQAPPSIQSKIIHVRAEDMSVFHDNEFDIVVSITAIHNFTDIRTGLQEMRRVGKQKFAFSVLKGGKLPTIEKEICSIFSVRKTLEDRHDRIFLIW